ncbi:MAG: OmpA family protein, partial [Cytophagales bacterium]|nr:OmpA family protein [Cytophagales bacterium]
AEAGGFVAINANIDLKNTEVYGELNKDLFLVPIEKGAVVRLNNIFFDFDKYVLKKESFPELNRMVEMMQENMDLKISVEGHTDNIGTQQYNFILSERRAKAVVDYLIENGISADRLQSKGFGKLRPIVSNDDEIDGRELNRRVEFKIIEE